AREPSSKTSFFAPPHLQPENIRSPQDAFRQCARPARVRTIRLKLDEPPCDPGGCLAFAELRQGLRAQKQRLRKKLAPAMLAFVAVERGQGLACLAASQCLSRPVEGPHLFHQPRGCRLRSRLGLRAG